ncbi:Leukocyte receptor cluster member 9 [Amphibalanus amphitrite]|uniref:Leukocyte receptor cluster member 9 n=1 Tax=Amphibalanus amphitrite TaxID=1232801 RepID=A0A6A4W4M9_AMPAM|nr:Leukocyte receptor cluster member 9 [Amphibalanus amphitrite]
MVVFVLPFLGVVEKPFSSFTWGDLPWQEYDVLAIPQHRIQYFTYRGVRVWDKASRLDAVFGSAGTTEDIEVAMTRIDAQVEEERQRRAAEARLAPADGEWFSDSDDEDDIQVDLQPAVTPAPAAGVPEEERSTHFLAVRVNSEEVRAAAERVQASVVRHDPSLGACAMRPALMHVTICMLRVQDTEAVAAAGRCVTDTIDELRETLRDDDRMLRMRGLRTFGARVLYASVAPCISFCAAVEVLRERLSAVPGVRVTNAFDYVPHMTLVKVSRPVARARRSRFIDAAGYASMENETLGEQRFDNVNLCAIDADCGLDGFYLTEASIFF